MKFPNIFFLCDFFYAVPIYRTKKGLTVYYFTCASLTSFIKKREYKAKFATRPERETHYLLKIRTTVLPQNLKLINRKRIQSRDGVSTRQSERLLKEHDNTYSQNLKLINRKRIQSRDTVPSRQSERLLKEHDGT